MLNNNKWILIIGGLIVTLLIFFLLPTHRPKVASQQSHTHQENLSSPKQANALIAPINILEIEKEKASKLNDADKALLKQLKSTVDNTPCAVAYKDLAEYWEKRDELNLAANYYKKAAFLENSEKSITFAGNLLMALMQKTSDPAVIRWQASEAIECFTKVTDMNPDNLDAKIALATCYTDGTGETMKGVALLREVTAKDSTNISANIILGKLAIQSGQYDKAIKRLELVLSLRQDNTEAMYFLAEAYKTPVTNKKQFNYSKM
jgi:Predicted N-acetylglucosaminyl transferase